MPNLYKYNNQWVTANQLREMRDGKKEVKEEPKTDSIEALRAKYKEVHPEGKGVPPAWINNADKIKEKIAEFTK